MRKKRQSRVMKFESQRTERKKMERSFFFFITELQVLVSDPSIHSSIHLFNITLIASTPPNLSVVVS